MTPEFSRIEPVDAIGEQNRTIAIAADPAERTALAHRFGLLAIDRLEAVLSVCRDAAGITLRGTVSAAVTQACAVTGDPVAVEVEEPVDLRFVDSAPVADEIELGDESVDTIEIEDGAIDLGETAAETVALALDPFPRSAGAAAALKVAGVVREEDARPFNAFAGLKDRMERG